jgi:hypothetical protein
MDTSSDDLVRQVISEIQGIQIPTLDPADIKRLQDDLLSHLVPGSGLVGTAQEEREQRKYKTIAKGSSSIGLILTWCARTTKRWFLGYYHEPSTRPHLSSWTREGIQRHYDG